jgi:hypothetical protein
MGQKSETPAGSLTGVSWNCLDATSAKTITLSAYCAQHFIAVYGISPELAVMLAALAFGGNSHEV